MIVVTKEVIESFQLLLSKIFGIIACSVMTYHQVWDIVESRWRFKKEKVSNRKEKFPFENQIS